MNSGLHDSPCSAANALAAQPADSPSLYRKLVLNALGSLTRGELKVHLPDDRVLSFGASSHEESAALEPRAPAAREIPLQAHLKVKREDFFRRCALYGDIGFAESYLEGEWETPDLRSVIAWFILNHEKAPTLSGSRTRALGLNLLRLGNRIGHLLRRNSRNTATRNIREHYDLSNEFFALWLDPSMMYSSALWSDPASSLEAAQSEKNEELCRKLRLRPGLQVLEIGTGWGGWALHAARHHGVHVTSLTLSPSQREWALRRVAEAGLQDRIEVRLQDYRQLPENERYDRIVSIEMLEAVGHEYLPDWCGVVSRSLKPEGLLALQFITCADHRYEQLRTGVDFIQKHVFPGSLLLSLNRLNEQLSRKGGFVLNQLNDLGQDYARTLACWRTRFQQRAEAVRDLGFDERFLRKWNYYLCYCEAAFALRHISVVQTLHTRPNNLSLT